MTYHLEKKIEGKRKEMLEAAREHGIDSKETLQKSLELDKLILACQKQDNY